MDPRRQARECAVQVLFQLDVTGVDPDLAFPAYWPERRVGPAVRAMAERLVRGAASRRVEIDGIIAEVSEHWRLERMPIVDRNILRLAIWEFLFEPGTPPIAVIDEAIELAKRFGGEDSGQFVNGFLDALRKKIESGEISVS